MIFLHITSQNVDDLRVVQKHIQQGDDLFIIVHKTGCPPCVATMPKWIDIEKELGYKYNKVNNVVIVDINEEVGVEQLAKFMGKIEGFPTIRYIGKEGKKIEEYENSGVKDPNRSTDSFIEWIESKVAKVETVTPIEEDNNKKHNYKEVHNRLTYRNNYRPRPTRKFRKKRYNKYYKSKKGKKYYKK